MITNELINNWAGTPSGSALTIKSLSDTGYESWTIKTGGEYGVAIPVREGEEISEYFAGAHYFTGKISLNDSPENNVLMLMTSKEEIKEQFASLCAELINPGENGELRYEISSNPSKWWMQWKELLGNKSVDSRVYDTLAELWTLNYLASRGEQAEWNGPIGATYDIDCDGYFVEVKSTTARNKRQITLSNLFQLDPPDGKPLFLVLCQFETSISGININDLVDSLVDKGYSRADLEMKLEKSGLERGRTARARNYILHAALEYKVDESFPAIRETSFVGGVLPSGVMSITYTVTLDGITGKNILASEE